ncbi:Stk1 family PASTA domain-containing Ser/Thr kinase [Herbiconiux sp. 11R-BC]|uniref:Stk1 family PASTA domain-containing Ser/Thr kinase n=1 Tax=Herbiconiux sp. 11R-BC TaxID=3111637 RepID=UPI003C109905
MTSAPPDPMIGRLIDGRYQVRSRIARGGMATVYLATDLRLERQVAIKIMHGHLADDAVFKERFVQEARSAARLAHPNVVNVFDQGQDSDMAYLVMEYLPGVTLRDLLKDYGKLTTEQTVDVMDAVLGGLSAAHKAGIVHRDLKPENVLLADDGRIKISDFGLARAVSANTATGQALLGTIAYLSPELLTRGTADARSDIYAAGIMMYEMLVGEQPYVGDQPMAIAFQHANDQMPTPSHKNPDIPEPLDDLVLWATAKNPDERPTDAREMLERLRTAEGEIVSARPSQNTTQRTMVYSAETFDADLDQAQTQVLETRRRTGPNAGIAAAAGAAVGGSADAAAATTVYGSAIAPTAAPAGAPATTAKLARKASKRRRRGFWIFALVLVVAVALGGGAWYFAAGPGSVTTVPDVAGQQPDAALSSLSALGFQPTQQAQSSTTVPSGTVIGTDPGSGTAAPNGSAVTVLVSSGPRSIPVPTLNGLNEADAQKAITAAGFTVGASTKQFDKAKAGTVISYAGPDGTVNGTQYFEQEAISLVVSAGPIPDVGGQTLDAAKATLQGVGLVGVEGSHDFNETVPEGQVYQATTTTDPVRPGDNITLDISRGPAPVTVPSGLNGMSWTVVKPQLVALGFDLQYNAVADAFPDTFKVSTTDPAGGTSVPRGSKLTVSFSVF